MSLAHELKQRGFVHQFSAETLEEIVDGQKRIIYHGIDPTADSAHAGNFVNWMLLRHFIAAGHKVIFLVGGGTGMIGDPKPDVERTLSSATDVSLRVAKIKTQAERILGGQDILFVNNADWLASLNLIEFLRDIGKHFTVNELVKKEAIAQRMSGENGISYTEFAYPLLQAYDYLTLNRLHGCDLQVGGSDQWGNMVAGIDLVRRMEQKQVHVVTVPLIVDKATGKKFGKSEGNAVWLDAEKTTPYQFYQFWLNTSDESVIDYLKLFTTLPLADIAAIERTALANPGDRDAQKILAREVTTIVHGEDNSISAASVSELLFGDKQISELNEEERMVLLRNAPTTSVEVGETLVDVLVKSNLATSKREARTFIESGAISINNARVSDTEILLEENLFNGSLAILRRGKKQVTVLQIYLKS